MGTRWRVAGRWGLGMGLWLASGLLLPGCPNPQTYGTPRTVAKGKVTHTVAVEGLYVGGEATTTLTTVDPTTGDTTTEERTEDISIGTPTLPTYQIRIGASDRVDVGIKVANLSSLGADVKLNPIRGKFDLAVDPGLQWFGVTINESTSNVFYLHLPVLLGLNLTPDFSVVATPGLLYSVAAGSVEGGNTDGSDAVFQSDGLAARLGLGFDIRISPSFALHPEATAIRGLTGGFGDTQGTIVVFGLGFNLANIPDYSDID